MTYENPTLTEIIVKHAPSQIIPINQSTIDAFKEAI